MTKKNAPVGTDANQTYQNKDTTDFGNDIAVKFDGNFDISTANSSRSVNWRNRITSWSKLLNRLSETHRTHEILQEYLISKKDRQDEIKNIGGWVGGYLSSGTRKKGNVLHRQVVTLDLDFATTDFWEDFLTTYGNAACLHSTHKHEPSSPRFRLIIPLSRPVFADEYMAIAHKIAGILDIELFDPTTFQAERLMYWPSTSKDGEFVFEYQDGEWLDADKVLNSYTNWKDSSEWPVSVKVETDVSRTIKKQEDPLEKTGIIGAWCRTYGIEDAIDTFLPDIYERSDIEGRFSYKHGSTAGGLVVYDDKFAYSHHGSDPVSGKLSNSFDLVRIHKFGSKDEDAKEDTSHSRLPSFTAMTDFAYNDEEVKSRLLVEKIENAKGEFNEELIEGDVETDWMTDLTTNKKNGNVLNTINNILLIIKNDPYFKGKIAFDDFEKCDVATKDLPWRTVTHATRRLTDDDDRRIRHYLESKYGITNPQKIVDGTSIRAKDAAFHPVRDYLKACKWDGTKRVDTLFIEYMGCEDNPYVRAVTRKSLVAACARIFQPGIKYDTMPVFVGAQGQMKSEMLRRLGHLWFSDNFQTVHGKEGIEQLQGVWLLEVPELAGLKKADVESTKSYIARQVDRYRVAYGRRVESFPRQCVPFGSTNKWDFLMDPTGNRRFWPLAVNGKNKTKHVFKDLTPEEVSQIWAEAYMFYEKGEPLHLTPEVEAIAFEVQEQHSFVDDRESLIVKYLDTLLPENWNRMDVWERREYLASDELKATGTMQRDRVCSPEIYCEALGGLQKDMSALNTRFIHDIMRKQPGWEPYKTKTTFSIYGTLRAYARKRDLIHKKNNAVIENKN